MNPNVIPVPDLSIRGLPQNAPQQAPMPQPMPQQMPQQQPRRGLLGGFFGPEGRDARARLAIGLEGLTMNPNQGLIGQLQSGIEERKADAERNRTLEYLSKLNTPQAARALEYAQATGDVVNALRMALTPADPMAAINLQKAQLELQQLENPQPGYRQVTGAQLGLTGPDAEKLFNLSLDGQVTAIGGSGPTVNVNTGAGSKFDEEFAKLDAKALADVSVAGNQAVRNLGRIDQLESLLANAPQGMEGAVTRAAGEFGINTEGLSDVQAAEAIISSLVPEQRPPGSGTMSDADLALFKQSLPRIINQPGGNALIINTMRSIARYDAEGAEIAQRFRAGEIDRAKAFELLQSRQNPLVNFRAPAAPVAGSIDAATQTGPVTITGDAEYNALPSGTEFIAPDGKLRRKP
jgi:hypothetical protein